MYTINFPAIAHSAAHNFAVKTIEFKMAAVSVKRSIGILLVVFRSTVTVLATGTICQLSGYLQEVKSKENFKLLFVNMVAVIYKRWSLTRGPKYSDLTWKLLVF